MGMISAPFAAHPYSGDTHEQRVVVLAHRPIDGQPYNDSLGESLKGAVAGFVESIVGGTQVTTIHLKH